MSIILGVPKEHYNGERRVSLVPESISKLRMLGIEVHVESQAGIGSFFTDSMYRDAGATVLEGRSELFRTSDIISTVRSPSIENIGFMKKNSLMIGLLSQDWNQEFEKLSIEKPVYAFSLDRLPRTTRAQSADVLTSQSSISGYVGAIYAASNSPRLMPMLTTAAGTVKPAKVLVLGAGVAGLMTIATLRRLGAVVTAYDVRRAAMDDVRSLGAKFLDTGIEASSAGGYARELTVEEKEEQHRMLVKAMTSSDVIITTAAVPGKRAPTLVSTHDVEQLRPGTVIVDLSADSGGNCELTKKGETVNHEHVKIVGIANPPSKMPVNSSEMFSRNITAFVQLMIKEDQIDYTFGDELLQECLMNKPGDKKNVT